ncbi:hypothetical protein D6C88_04408 [Aureobasidium pullulans]|nr:hypothetical protein D6C88_04408 [Aureobasidium pullulans]
MPIKKSSSKASDKTTEMIESTFSKSPKHMRALQAQQNDKIPCSKAMSKFSQEARVRQIPNTQRQSAVHEKFLEYKAEQAHKVFLARRTMARSICDIDWSIDDKTQEEWAKQRDAWATSSEQAKSGKARNEVDDKECGFEEEYPSSEEVEYEYPGGQEYPDPFKEVQYGYPDE